MTRYLDLSGDEQWEVAPEPSGADDLTDDDYELMYQDECRKQGLIYLPYDLRADLRRQGKCTAPPRSNERNGLQ